MSSKRLSRSFVERGADTITKNRQRAGRRQERHAARTALHQAIAEDQEAEMPVTATSKMGRDNLIGNASILERWLSGWVGHPWTMVVAAMATAFSRKTGLNFVAKFWLKDLVTFNLQLSEVMSSATFHVDQDGVLRKVQRRKPRHTREPSQYDLLREFTQDRPILQRGAKFYWCQQVEQQIHEVCNDRDLCKCKTEHIAHPKKGVPCHPKTKKAWVTETELTKKELEHLAQFDKTDPSYTICVFKKLEYMPSILY